ncbi:MAG: hypothetical protein ACKVP2_10545 [Burkholderiales bacterium]
MHSIDTAIFNPRHHWGGIESSGPSGAVARADRRREHHDVASGGAPAQGVDFARRAVHAEVMSSIRSVFQFVTPVPIPGLAPAEQAGQTLAAAASQALARGEQGAQALREGMESGLQEASTQLQGLGLAIEDIVAAADDLRARLEGLIGGTSASGEIAVAGRIRQKQKTQLEIVTQEGDVVRLSLKTRMHATIAGAAVGTTDGVSSGASVRTISGAKLEISVEGNLNDEEAAAIREVLLQVEELSDKFFAGDTQAAFAAASQMGVDGEQLASVAIKMSFRQRIEASGFVTHPLPAPAPETPSAPPTSGQDLPVAEAVPLSSAAASPPASTPDPAAQPTLPGVQTLPQAPSTESPLAGIGRFLAEVLRAFNEASQTGQGSLDLRFKLDLLLSVTRVVAQSEPSPTSATPAIEKLEEATSALIP